MKGNTMSWHVSGIGKPKVLIANLPAEFDRVHCEEPEQLIKAFAKDIVLASLEHYPDDMAVKVTASGSQSKEHRPDKDRTKSVNSLDIKIEPLWGFVE
jgi:hypothetical protein